MMARSRATERETLCFFSHPDTDATLHFDHTYTRVPPNKYFVEGETDILPFVDPGQMLNLKRSQSGMCSHGESDHDRVLG